MSQCNALKPIERIVIVGGGTAGWLCAGMLAAKLSSRFGITLIESPTISTIGVGEGSWPSLRDTLIDIGIDEKTFITQCHASYKQGSSFVNWQATSTNQHVYYHPFTVPTGYNELNIHACWQALAKKEKYQDAFSLQAAMCEAGKAPKQMHTPDFAHVLNYGYHFDATALADILKSHCTEKLNVNYVKTHVENVINDEHGFITKLITHEGAEIEGDFFVDCSGQQSLLIEKHFNVPWVSVDNILVNNRAVAAQVPYTNTDNAIASTTIATAQHTGWTWDIGLQHRRGVGLVYGDAFINEDKATEILFEQIYKRYCDNKASLSVKALKFSPGYRKQFWVKNCLSLGMSSGFVEPLEASAIAMVELGLRMLCDAFPHDHHHMSLAAKRYNSRFSYRWQRVIDFLKLHYVLSKREEPYWRAQRETSSIPDSLAELLENWRYQSPSRLDLIENEEVFPSASYQYVLYGMGFDTASPATSLSRESIAKANDIRNKMQQMQKAYLHGLPSHRTLLDHVSAQYKKGQQ